MKSRVVPEVWKSSNPLHCSGQSHRRIGAHARAIDITNRRKPLVKARIISQLPVYFPIRLRFASLEAASIICVGIFCLDAFILDYSTCELRFLEFFAYSLLLLYMYVTKSRKFSPRCVNTNLPTYHSHKGNCLKNLVPSFCFFVTSILGANATRDKAIFYCLWPCYLL
jgi:hypothetical protein